MFKISSTEKEKTLVSLKHIAEITQARAEEILNLIDKELKKIDRSGMLPAGVILTGGGSKLNGFLDLAKEKLKLPVFLGLPLGLDNCPIDKVRDPAFAPALGLALWGIQNAGGHQRRRLEFSSVDEVIDKMKGWFKSLLP